MIDVTTVPAWAGDLVRIATRDRGIVPHLDSPAVQLALKAKAALQERAEDSAQCADVCERYAGAR